MERRRLLLVIDNAESLLTQSGQWRDDNWGGVVGALTSHQGLGRLILTSRRLPAGLTGLRVEAVDALSPDEALLLARELPNLRRLIYDELPGIDRDDSRRLALGVLKIAQGHPKLLELANGQARRPDRLVALVAAGDQAWREQGGLPDGFFATGGTSTGTASAASTGDYWHVLAAWTNAVADTLSPGERDLFWFLCCLEEPDRERRILNVVWPRWWRQLGRDSEPPGLDEALAAAAAAGLIAIRPPTEDTDESFAVHPGVTEAGRGRAGIQFRDTADAAAAEFWGAVYQRTSGEEGGPINTGMAVRAGLAALPYLLRRQQWAHAARLLERALIADPSRATAATALPAIQCIARHEPRSARLLTQVLQVLDPAAAETALRSELAAAIAAGEYQAASAIAGSLLDLCRVSGRLAEALILSDQVISYSRRADLGPWTQLADEVRRLRVLVDMGQADHVLAEVIRLRGHLATLPTTLGPREALPPWNAVEALLDVGRAAANQLSRWEVALKLNAASIATKRKHGVPATSIAQNRYNDYAPLLRLGRTDQALALLQDCLQVFRDAHHTKMIGKVLSALAETEAVRGHGNAAISLEHDALRHKYLADDVGGLARGYHKLGSFLGYLADRPAPALASHLAAALIRALTGFDTGFNPLAAAATDLRKLGTTATLPTSVADLDRQLGDIPGTDLSGLIAKLSPDAETAEQALRDLVAKAQELAAAPVSDEQ